MKSFFKKLAFVMALAMVVTLAAPAAAKTAYAASNITISYQNEKSTITELNIAKVGQSEDLKFNNAPKGWEKLNPTWKSSDESVATVDKNGLVTAVAAGTAVVTFTCGDQSASVKVNCVNTATYTATIGVASDKNMSAKTIEVGDEFDFAFYGIKDYSADRYFCTWASDDTSVATVDQKGLVTAVKPGTAKITLIVFNKVTGQVHNVAPVLVTVPGEATPTPTTAPVASDKFTAVQKGVNAFTLTFEDAKTAEQIKEKLEVTVKIGNRDYAVLLDEVNVDGKVATVSVLSTFENEQVYKLTYAEESHDVVIVLGEVANVGVTYWTKTKGDSVAFVSEDGESDVCHLEPTLYDKYGNDVTALYNLNNFVFVYTLTGTAESTMISGNQFLFSKSGVADVTVEATWFDTTKNEPGSVTGNTLIKVEKHPSVIVSFVKAGAVSGLVNDSYGAQTVSWEEDFLDNPNSVCWDYTTLNFTYGGNPATYKLSSVFTDNRDNTFTAHNYKYGTFSYTSNNMDVATVSDTDLTINGAGRANILVYFTSQDGLQKDKLVGSFAVTVKEQPYPVSYKLVSTNVSLASHVVDSALNNGYVVLQVFDQYGDKYKTLDSSYIQIEATDKSNNPVGILSASGYASWAGGYPIYVDGDNYKDLLATITGSTVQNLKSSASFGYKVSILKNDATSKITTPYAAFSVTVVNTASEMVTIRDFIAGTTQTGYAFRVSISGGGNVDLNTEKVINYKNTNRGDYEMSKKATLTYDSKGGYALAYVPADKIVQKGTAQTTGEPGTVYYSVSAPAKRTVANTVVNNANYYLGENDETDKQFKLTLGAGVADSHPATGAYSISFSYTNTYPSTNGNGETVYASIAPLKTISWNVTDTSKKPIYAGYDEEALVSGYSDEVLFVKNVLKFTFDELTLGAGYGNNNKWNDATYITIDTANTNIDFSQSGKVIVNKVAFTISGDGTGNGSYTVIVNVGKTFRY